MSEEGERVIELVADRDRPSAFMVRIDGTDQSYVDLEDPIRLEFDYVQRMADALDAHAGDTRPMRVVHIGGAGLTLPRYITSTRPRSPQIVLEPDEELTACVRSHLPLPARSGIKVRAIDGRLGIDAMRADFADVVVLDAFDGARVPADLTTAEFFASVAEVLVHDGVFLLNVTDHTPFPYVRRVVAGLRSSFSSLLVSAEPATLKGRRFGNLLIGAGHSALSVDALRRKAASSPFPYRVLDDDEAHRVFAGATPFTVEDASMSPPPPGGKAFFS